MICLNMERLKKLVVDPRIKASTIYLLTQYHEVTYLGKGRIKAVYALHTPEEIFYSNDVFRS